MNTPIFIVYHIYPHFHWKEHVQDKFSRINKYQLSKEIFEMYCVVVSPKNEDIEWLQKECIKNNLNNKIKIIQTQKNNFEHESIKLVKEIGDNNNGFTLYFHTKGCGKEIKDHRENWDSQMAYTVINNWRICLKKLKFYNCVGLYIREQAHTKKIHFSGNFWWAKNDYIKTLSKIENVNKDRFYYEFWIAENKSLINMNPFCPLGFLDKEQFLNNKTYKNIDFSKNNMGKIKYEV